MLAAALDHRQQDIVEELLRKAARDHGNRKGRNRDYFREALLHRVVYQIEHGIYS
jgi:hypothetical protein